MHISPYLALSLFAASYVVRMPSGIVTRDAVDDAVPNPRGHMLATISIIFGVISSVLIIARWITRITVHRSTGSDDYVITIAGVSASLRKGKGFVDTADDAF